MTSSIWEIGLRTAAGTRLLLLRYFLKMCFLSHQVSMSKHSRPWPAWSFNFSICCRFPILRFQDREFCYIFKTISYFGSHNDWYKYRSIYLIFFTQDFDSVIRSTPLWVMTYHHNFGALWENKIYRIFSTKKYHPFQNDIV